jgi:hypothetical protein
MRAACALLFVFPSFAETLRYTINWPSGLSLGEGSFSSIRGKDAWNFELNIDASIPGFVVRDQYKSSANVDLCTTELEKKYVHGKRKAHERTVFDQGRGKATRETLDGGGKSEVSFRGCGRDALAFIQFLRKELSQGRLPPQQSIVFGAVYNIRLEFSGTQVIKIGDQRHNADRLQATLKGPSTDITFELYFAKDSVRTPLLVRVPLSLGAFTMELTE